MAFAISFAAPLSAQQATTTDIGTLDRESAEQAFKQRPYSPYAGRNFPTRPLFDDTHTSFSMDAGAFGARLGPKDAYRSAKGEEITASSGQQAKLSRPLDFLVATDHSDGFGFFPRRQVATGGRRILRAVVARRKERPQLFGHPFDGPMEGHHPLMPHGLNHCDLHVWLWKTNSAGRRRTRT